MIQQTKALTHFSPRLLNCLVACSPRFIPCSPTPAAGLAPPGLPRHFISFQSKPASLCVSQRTNPRSSGVRGEEREAMGQGCSTVRSAFGWAPAGVLCHALVDDQATLRPPAFSPHTLHQSAASTAGAALAKQGWPLCVARPSPSAVLGLPRLTARTSQQLLSAMGQ